MAGGKKVIMKACLFQRVRRMRYVPRIWCLERLSMEKSAGPYRTCGRRWIFSSCRMYLSSCHSGISVENGMIVNPIIYERS